jgi:predicted molibdopterin-dependent oxidoreductase YjgC
MKYELPTSIEIEMFKNVQPSIKSTSRGIVIDSRSENENAFDLMRLSRELFSNEIDESDLHCEKHDEQRISAFRGIVIDLIGWVSKERRPMTATRSERGEEGGAKTMTSLS